MSTTITHSNELGSYLKDRRTKLDPAALGLSMKRRRTRGLRREEVAQRAHVSTTWYTWLEQGRGGAPSTLVLDSLARALMLNEIERQHLYLLAFGRLPEVQYQPTARISPQLQAVLDALDLCPALIRTATWDVVGWNKAASVVMTDYGELEKTERNIVKLVFTSHKVRQANAEWEILARMVVAAFRADITRAGAAEKARALVEELCATSPEFAKMWRSNDVLGHAEGSKKIRHPIVGPLALQFSSFSVDGSPDLSMIVYTPATESDRRKVRSLLVAAKSPA